MKPLATIVTILALFCCIPLVRADDTTQRTAAAEELLKAMHVDAMLVKQKENIIKMMSSFAPKDLSEEKRQEILKKQSELFDSMLNWDTLKVDFIQAYSETYTEKELKDLTAFYNSPVGQKFIEKMPELQKKTMDIMQKRMMALLPQLQKVNAPSAKTPESASSAAPASSAPKVSP